MATKRQTIYAKDNPEIYKSLDSKTIFEAEEALGEFQDIRIEEKSGNKYGIVLEFIDPQKSSIVFYFTRKLDFFRFQDEKSDYSRLCQFAYFKNKDETFDIQFGKLPATIQKPLIYADDYAIEFQKLDKITVAQYDEIEKMEGYEYVGELESYGIKMKYSDPLKPDIVFRFSETLDRGLLSKDGEKYLSQCQFLFWQDSIGNNIRLGRPYIYLTSMKSLVK